MLLYYALVGILIICVIIFLVRGYFSIRSYLENKRFIKCYTDILHNQPNAYKEVSDFVDKTKSLDNKNQGLILKLYEEIKNDLDYSKTIEELDIVSIFYKNKKFSYAKLKSYSDIFLFINLCLSKAYVKGKEDVVQYFLEKFSIEDFDLCFECQFILNFIKALLKEDDRGANFMVGSLDGNYSSYIYNKASINLYLKLATTILAYSGVEYEESDTSDIQKFSKTLIGSTIMKDLGIFEQFNESSDNKLIEDKK